MWLSNLIAGENVTKESMVALTDSNTSWMLNVDKAHIYSPICVGDENEIIRTQLSTTETTNVAGANTWVLDENCVCLYIPVPESQPEPGDCFQLR